MTHLTEEELVSQAFGERRGEAAAGRHLAGCSECANAFAALQFDLAAMGLVATPERDPGYGERVWQSISPSLRAYTPQRRSWMSLGVWKGLGYAAACALLLACAFFSGMEWDHWKQPQTTAVKQAAPEVKQPVILVVLGDHLDRSERLLVELKHADARSPELVSPMRDEARNLLAANRVCRQDAAQIGDPALATALDRLDPLLAELANQPGGLNSATISRLQEEMNADGLLFEVRVLRARLPDSLVDKRAGTASRSTGGTI
jgi:hypothetical protein